MRKYAAREALASDLNNFVAWMHENRNRNGYDPSIFGYQATKVIAVDKDGNPMCYLPYQYTIMTESLAPKPARTKGEIARALQVAIHEVARRARASGIGEIYFLSDPEDVHTRAFAKTHGYEELPLMVMRLKLKDMNPPLPEDVKELGDETESTH